MYDTIVLGNDPGSLVAAVTLANQGKKTLLLTDDTPLYYSESGYTFDIDPLPWSGFGRGNPFKQFLSHSGIIVEGHPFPPPLQIIFQKHRIDLSGMMEKDRGEMEREFPEKGSDITDFFNSLSKSGQFASGLIDKGLHLRPESLRDRLRLLRILPSIALKKREFSAKLKALQQSPSLGKIMEAQILLFSHLDPYTISPIAAAKTLSTVLQGLCPHREGKHLLMDKLKKKFEADGGVTDENPVSTIEMERVIKVNLQPDEAQVDSIPTIYGRNIIISTYCDKLSSLMEENRALGSVKKRYGRIQPSLYPVTLHLGVNDRCIPERMGSYVVVISDETKPAEEGNFLFLETSEPGNLLQAPEGKRALSLTSFVKNPPSETEESALQAAMDGMIQNVRYFLPFLEENIDFMNLEESIRISKEYEKIRGLRYKAQSTLAGLSFLSGRTPIKNVYLTGNALIPGLGFEGEIISGINAARLATERG